MLETKFHNSMYLKVGNGFYGMRFTIWVVVGQLWGWLNFYDMDISTFLRETEGQVYVQPKLGTPVMFVGLHMNIHEYYIYIVLSWFIDPINIR